MFPAGVWDMRGKQFHKGVEIGVWALVIFAQYRYCPEEKIKYVTKGGRGYGNWN